MDSLSSTLLNAGITVQDLEDEQGKINVNAQTDNIDRAIIQLSSRVDGLESLMKKVILDSHEDLLKQVVGVKAVDSSLCEIEDQLREVKIYMHSLRTKIRVPYEQMLMYMNQSNNLHSAMRYVRALSKLIQLVRRLRQQVPDSLSPKHTSEDSNDTDNRNSTVDSQPDYSLAALTLLDIERVVGDGDLTGIDVVDSALEDIVKWRHDLTIKEAEKTLDDGMKRLSQKDISGGLQILFNLGTLATKVADKARLYTTQWSSYVSGRLDPKRIQAQVREHNTKATSVDGSDMIGISSVLWSTLESIIDELLSRGLELRALERVLVRKRDALPHFDISTASILDSKQLRPGEKAGVSFADLVIAKLGDRPLAFWWGTAIAALSREIESACKDSVIFRQTLTNSYPRLVQLFMPKLEQILSPKLGGVASVGASVLVSTGSPAINPILSSTQSLSNLSLQETHTPMHLIQSTVAVTYDDPGIRILWDKLLAGFEAEYVAKAGSRIDDAVKRCYPPPPPPGLLDAQENWRKGPSKFDAQTGNSNNRGPTELELMTAVSIVPNKKLVAGIVRSVSTELEMAKSDLRLHCSVADIAATAVSSFISITEHKISGITTNPSVLNPLSQPPHPLTRTFVGLINAAEGLSRGLTDLCRTEFGAVIKTSSNTRVQSLASRMHLSRTSGTNSFVASQRQSPYVVGNSPRNPVLSILTEGIGMLDEFISSQTERLLQAADSTIKRSVLALTNKDTAEYCASDPMAVSSNGIDKQSDLETSLQWLNNQVLEYIEVDCKDRVFKLVDTFLRLYTRTACLTFPLSEEAKLGIIGEATKFEFACSQLVTSSGKNISSISNGQPHHRSVSPSRYESNSKPKLSDIGAAYHAFRLLRQLLFFDTSELAKAVKECCASKGEWKNLSQVDIIDHTICCAATEYNNALRAGSIESGSRFTPYDILGWTREQWISFIFYTEGNPLGEFTVPPIKSNSVWLQGNTKADLDLKLVLLRSADDLLQNTNDSDTEMKALIQYIIDFFSSSKH